jgi:hypothetical protein
MLNVRDCPIGQSFFLVVCTDLQGSIPAGVYLPIVERFAAVCKRPAMVVFEMPLKILY